MLNIFSNNYLTRKPIEKSMQKFAQNFSPERKVLDIGCGDKPYKNFFNCHYVGLDSCPETKAEIIADSRKIPCRDNEFDGIILNQVLEHIAETKDTITEIKRILKPGGLCIITAPQTVMIHSTPIPSLKVSFINFNKDKIKFWNEDYYRFTRYGLAVLFKEFRVVDIRPDTYYFGTIFQLINYFFAAFGFKYVFIPIYFVNNCLGLLMDKLLIAISNIPLVSLKKFRWFILESLTINNIAILKKND